ncbi:MAG: hypothetical protein N2C12_15750 [Planctomycetales bacterium]
MIKSNALPTRRQERIDTTICKVCFVAIPAQQTDTHIAWHEERRDDLSKGKA